MPGQLYRPNTEKVAAEIIDGEAIIINVATGNYYNTEGIGGWVWQQCAEGKSVDEIAELAQSRFQVSPAQVGADLASFFSFLEEEELVSKSDWTAPASARDEEAFPVETGIAGLPYQTPKLVAYRDLKDLLALDPPMPRLTADKAEAPVNSAR